MRLVGTPAPAVTDAPTEVPTAGGIGAIGPQPGGPAITVADITTVPTRG